VSEIDIKGIKIKKTVLIGAGAVIAALLGLMMISGDDAKIAPQINQTLVPGNTYTLFSPNVGIGEVLLVRSPGQFSSREDESADSNNVCVVAGSTPAVFEQETLINYISYVKVKPKTGTCVGKTGWTSKVNLK
jgi:hypothetical protein